LAAIAATVASGIRAAALATFTADTLHDDKGACVRGCYRCLLSYGNQGFHELIDRREVVGLLQRLASATTRTAITGPAVADRTMRDTGGPPGRLLRYLRDHDLRWPSETATLLEGLRVDLVYHDSRSVVILAADPGDITPLVFNGWNVVTVAPDVSVEAAVAAHPTVFGVVSA
jgi:hypothetical protein